MRCVASISLTSTVSREVSKRQPHPQYSNYSTSIVAYWKPPTYNSPYMNWKRGMYAMTGGIFLVEPVRHFASNVHVMNQFYEWPKTRSEYNIFFKEVFRLPDFWSELSKK